MNIKFFNVKNKNMKLFKDICLYLSSFIPLYFLVVVKELLEIINGNLSFNITNGIMISLNLVMIGLGIFGVLWAMKKEKYVGVEVVEFKNTTQENFLPYFPLFVLFALAFELEYISMAVVYLIIICLLGIVYIKNNLFHINPFLNIIGFSTYKITYKINEETKTEFCFGFKEIGCSFYKFNGFFIKR